MILYILNYVYRFLKMKKKKLVLKIGDDNYVLWYVMYCILNFLLIS